MKSIGNDIPNAVDESSHPEKTLKILIKTTVRRSFQVVFAPWKIPQIAMRCSSLYALLVSSFVLTWEINVIIHGYFAGMGEPFADWEQYFFSFNTPIVYIFFVIQTTVLFFILRFFTSLFSYVFKINLAAIRAVLLTPTILILPSHIWAFATMITTVREPSFSFSICKPEWINWHIFTLLSEPYWLAIGVIALIGVSIVNALRVRKMYRQKNSLDADSSVPK